MRFAKASEFSKPRARERLQYASFKLQIGDAANGKRLLEAITKEQVARLLDIVFSHFT